MATCTIVAPGYSFFEGADVIFVVNDTETRAVAHHPDDDVLICCFKRRLINPQPSADAIFDLYGWVTTYDEAEEFLTGHDPDLMVGIGSFFMYTDPTKLPEDQVQVERIGRLHHYSGKPD